MNVLGMGPMEIVLIVVLALIVFGPAKLPEIMGQVGKAINDFRRATSELSDELNRTIQAELADTAQWSWETAAPAMAGATVETSPSASTTTLSPAVESTQPSTQPNVEVQQPAALNPLSEPARPRAKSPSSSELLPPY